MKQKLPATPGAGWVMSCAFLSCPHMLLILYAPSPVYHLARLTAAAYIQEARTGYFVRGTHRIVYIR